MGEGEGGVRCPEGGVRPALPPQGGAQEGTLLDDANDFATLLFVCEFDFGLFLWCFCIRIGP